MPYYIVVYEEGKRFQYIYGSLEVVSRGDGSGLSSVQSPEVVDAVLSGIRKKGAIPAIGVCQFFYGGEQQGRIREALIETSQRVIKRAYGERDAIFPFLTAIIYDSQMGDINEIKGALPKSPIERIVLYPANRMPRFDQKKNLAIDPEAKDRAIHNCMTPKHEDYLKNYIDIMGIVSREYGLTLPEFIMLDSVKPDSRTLACSKDVLLEQKTDVNLLFLLLLGVDLNSES